MHSTLFRFRGLDLRVNTSPGWPARMLEHLDADRVRSALDGLLGPLQAQALLSIATTDDDLNEFFRELGERVGRPAVLAPLPLTRGQRRRLLAAA